MKLKKKSVTIQNYLFWDTFLYSWTQRCLQVELMKQSHFSESYVMAVVFDKVASSRNCRDNDRCTPLGHEGTQMSLVPGKCNRHCRFPPLWVWRHPLVVSLLLSTNHQCELTRRLECFRVEITLLRERFIPVTGKSFSETVISWWSHSNRFEIIPYEMTIICN